MSSLSLLWIGRDDAAGIALRGAVERELDDVTTATAATGGEGLEVLAADPGKHLLVVVELKAAEMDVGSLITGIKQINPAIEVVVLGGAETSWGKLALPRYYRPIFLSDPCGSEALISCLAKLKEIVEAKEDYARLSRGIGSNIAMARKNTEALLAILHRQNNVGMISIRRDGFFVSCNQEAQRLTGYSLEELAHVQSWVENLLLDQESVKSFLAALEDAWARKTGREKLDVRIRRSDRVVLNLSMSLLVLPDEVGHARQIMALFFDPLESRAAREYQLLARSRKLGLYSYQPGRGFLRITQTALNLLNNAFKMDLAMAHVIDRQVRDLPFPERTAILWQQLLEETAQGSVSPSDVVFPIGLPGGTMVEHKFIDRMNDGFAKGSTVVAVITSSEQSNAGPGEDPSHQTLALKTLNAIPRPVLILKSQRDTDGLITELICVTANPAASELLGFSQRFIQGSPLGRILVYEPAVQTVTRLTRHCIETGKSRQFEIWLKRKHESETPILVRFSVFKVGDGAALFLRDVTAMREEERQLKQYRHVFSYMDEAIIVTDLDGYVIDWNPASERMFGYPKDMIVGQSAYILTQNPAGDQLEQHSKSVLREGDVWKGEYEFVRADGSPGVAFSVFALLKDDHGTPYGTVGLCHDLTERKRLEERLTAKSRELQDTNLALNTLLRHAEEERVRACQQVVTDLSKKITERIHRIMDSKGRPQLVETHANLLLQEVSAGPDKTATAQPNDPALKLSEKEREVAKLIRLGKTTDEIAFILDKSPDTIRLQRISIRKKLGLTRKDSSLATYLRNLDL